MRFFTDRHQNYCGIDLHARSMYLCIQNLEGKVVLHRNMQAGPEPFLKAIEPFREDVVVGVECIFTWYWLADLCAEHNIPFILGHALYMKAIHGGKAKNDRIDSRKIAALMRGGTFPMAYVYPARMRATRDLLRRRNHLTRKRADLLSHIQNTNSQYNMEPFEANISYKRNRVGVAEQFVDPDVRMSMQADLELIALLDDLKNRLELHILHNAKDHDPQALYRLRTVPGIGPIISLVILYEIGDISRFPRVQDFASYARLVKCAKESAGKRNGTGGSKIGNVHLKWAFSEAAVLFLRGNSEGMKFRKKLEKKHGKAKSLSILAHKLGRAVYYVLKRDQAFDMAKFVRT
ncbi:MAG: IS110 family transposase [Gammaproteobacteria bacterium]|nr:MAG: IS110 family transposase [Gammaproteobacteria bacterium]